MKYMHRITGLILILWISTSYGYNRADYPHWLDVDNDGQNTREEVLIRDSLVPVTFRQDGKVKKGLWVCPYTGRVTENPTDFDADHLIALGEIDEAGGHSWTTEQRAAFANDMDNLVAVYKGSNRSKGDKDAYEWLPPNIAYCTTYLDARAAVWAKYGIEMDDNEKNSVKFFKSKCPKHEKGIKLNRVRRWLGTWFDGLF